MSDDEMFTVELTGAQVAVVLMALGHEVSVQPDVVASVELSIHEACVVCDALTRMDSHRYPALMRSTVDAVTQSLLGFVLGRERVAA